MAETVSEAAQDSRAYGFVRDPLYLRVSAKPELAAVLLMLFMALFLGLSTEAFLSAENLFWIAQSVSVIALAAIGMLFVMAAGDIDLSIGSQIGLSSIVVGRLAYSFPGIPDAAVIAAAIAVGLLFGLINGVIVVKFRFNAFIATLATGYIGRGATIVASENRNFSGFSPSLTFLGQGKIFGIPVLVLITAAIAILVAVILQRTVFGRQLFAVGGNPSAARLSGVPVDRVRITGFVVCGGLGGIAGLLLACRLGVTQQTIGVGYEMEAVAAAVIGGISIFGGVGSVVGALVGSIAMAMIRNGLVLLQIGAMWQTLATGSIIVIAVIIDGIRRRFRA